MNTNNRKTLYNETTIKRKVPENYTPGEEHLYKGGLSYVMPAAFYYELSGFDINEYFVFSKQGVSLPETYLNYPGKRSRLRLFIKSLLFAFEKPKETKRGKYLWVVNEWSHNYFHWFTDAISKYYLMKEKEGIVRLLIPISYIKFNYVPGTLRLLNIPYEFIEEKKTRVTELLFPEIRADLANYFPGVLNKIREDIMASVQPVSSTESASDRIYISRKMAGKRRVTNEDEIAPVLKKFGFEIVCLESLEFEKQVRLMANARILLGMHGAGLTNMLFMPKRQKIIEIIVNGKGHNNCYFNMANELNHEYYYMVGDAADPNDPDTNISADPVKLEKLLERVLRTG